MSDSFEKALKRFTYSRNTAFEKIGKCVYAIDDQGCFHFLTGIGNNTSGTDFITEEFHIWESSTNHEPYDSGVYEADVMYKGWESSTIDGLEYDYKIKLMNNKLLFTYPLIAKTCPMCHNKKDLVSECEYCETQGEVTK